jgi:hypothetical protein
LSSILSGNVLRPTLGHYHEKHDSLAHVAWFARDISALCERMKKEIYPGLRPELQARVRRRIIKVLELYAHASELIKQWQRTAPGRCGRGWRRL